MRTKKIAETQLDRIENGIRALLDRVYFPTRNAFDGIKGEELTEAIRQETERRNQCVERMLAGDWEF